MTATPSPYPDTGRALFRASAACLCIFAATPLAAQSNDNQGGLDEDVFELSPFEVNADQNQVGYYAGNTLAGSRMNTKISDLAASITVVTKQQMEDTASLDINDVFRYELNTEGAATYTPSTQSFRTDGIVDSIAGASFGNRTSVNTVASANRMRGIGAPDRTINYYLALGVPFDAYNIETLEINRGPNSMIFGLGSPAGIVNINWARAHLEQESMQLAFRTDDRGSGRASFSFNKPITDKLAVFGAVLYEDQQFERKPSYDITRRQYGTITYEPFKKTRLRFSIENYNNDNRRPNNLTPRDGVTPWREAGRPVYDPTTLSVTKLDTGEQIGPYVFSGESSFADQQRAYIASLPGYDPSLWDESRTTYDNINIFKWGAGLTNQNSPMFIPGITWNSNRPIMEIDNGNVVNYYTPEPGTYVTHFGTDTNPAGYPDRYPSTEDIFANPVWDRVYSSSHTQSAFPATPELYPDWKWPSVTDKSIYDWTKYNISSMNFGSEDNVALNLELDQELIPNLLHFNAGWFREDHKISSNYTVGQLNASTLFVETTTHLPDGTPNPRLGHVYVEDLDPDQFVTKDLNNQFRALLAFTPDFTGRDDIFRWLGHHQIMGMAQRYQNTREDFRNRVIFTDSSGVENGTIRWMPNPNPDADGNPTGWNYQGKLRSVRRLYYLTDMGAPEGTVTDDAGEIDASPYTGDIMTYNYDRSAWEPISLTSKYITTNAGTGKMQRRIDTFKAGTTSYFWEDRIIATLGISHDKFKARSTTEGEIVREDGTVIPKMTDAEKFVDGYYQYDEAFKRWGNWDELSGTTTTTGVVFAPFRNWGPIENRARESAFFDFLANFSVFYNKSDNFNPPNSDQTDPFGNKLNKPTGKGKDYGFQFSALDNKLYTRVTWFKASSEDERINMGAAYSRVSDLLDVRTFRKWAETIVLINQGFDPRVEDSWDQTGDWVKSNRELFESKVSEIWGQDYDYYDTVAKNASGTQDVDAKGVEISINYNPIPNWTLRWTGSKQETTYSDVTKQFDPWNEYRQSVWKSAKASNYLLPQYQDLAEYDTWGGGHVKLGDFWNDSYSYVSHIDPGDPFGSVTPAKYYDNTVTPNYLFDKSREGNVAPNQRKYRWSLITNYAFTEKTRLKGINLGGSVRWEDKATIGYYGMPVPGSGEDLIRMADIDRPIYDKSRYYFDVWVGYTRRIMDDRVRMKLQLNVVNAFEDGRLQPIAVNFDGTPYAYRIVDPRQFIFSASFDF